MSFPGRLREQGAAIVEFAIIVPVLILFGLNIYDVGNLLYHHSVLTELAREGVRYAEVLNVPAGELQADVSTRISAIYAMGSAGSPSLQSRLNLTTGIVTTTTLTGSDISVSVSGTYDGIIPPWKGIPVSAVATGSRM